MRLLVGRAGLIVNKAERKDYVVYAYARAGKDRFGNHGTYYYIGKGTPKRPYDCSVRRVKCPRNRSKDIHILYKGLDEKTAFEKEKEMIAKYGRADKYPEWGILRNLTDGGEGASGYRFDEETKKKMSRDRSGKNSRSYISRNWCHPEHGFVPDRSARDIQRDYPDSSLNGGTLCMVAKGKHRQLKGWIFISDEMLSALGPEEDPHVVFSKQYAIEKIEEFKRIAGKNRSGSNNWNHSPRCWSHDIHGFVENASATDLVKMFPDQKLGRGNLTNVANGALKWHKGWKSAKCEREREEK